MTAASSAGRWAWRSRDCASGSTLGAAPWGCCWLGLVVPAARGRKAKGSRIRAGERRPEGAGELRSPESEVARPRGAGTLRWAVGSRRWRRAGGDSPQQRRQWVAAPPPAPSSSARVGTKGRLGLIVHSSSFFIQHYSISKRASSHLSLTFLCFYFYSLSLPPLLIPSLSPPVSLGARFYIKA